MNTQEEVTMETLKANVEELKKAIAKIQKNQEIIKRTMKVLGSDLEEEDVPPKDVIRGGVYTYPYPY